MHPEMKEVQLDIPLYKKIAIALDFSENDPKLLSYAIGLGHPHTSYILIHVVESVSAALWASQSDDYETQKDKMQLEGYVAQLQAKGLQAEAKLGFRHRSREIVRLVTETNADLLVMGAHGHKGFKDLLYGQTVNTVRHHLTIPVLTVNLKG